MKTKSSDFRAVTISYIQIC